MAFNLFTTFGNQFMPGGTLNMFGGAEDVIVVTQHDASLRSSPWFAQFNSAELDKKKPIRVTVNGSNIPMDLYLSDFDTGRDGQPTFTPTSATLASMKLRPGRNEMTFTISNVLGQDQKVEARMYWWNWNTKIVVVDVDGTITETDLMGHLMPVIGLDSPTHPGICKLLTELKEEEGTQIMYLSARSISQADATRKLLSTLRQGGKTLPDGPVIISPDGRIASLFREVIKGTPHEFKIACLKKIEAAFPIDHKPFWKGFGNKETDRLAYLGIGIRNCNIFIIDSEGTVVSRTTYDDLCEHARESSEKYRSDSSQNSASESL